MNENTIWLAVTFVGLVIFMILFYFMILAPGQRRTGTEYDERQLLARNKAYKYSFIFLLLYCTTCALLEILEIKWAIAPVMLFIGTVGSVTLFVTICIIKDAYNEFRLKNKPSGIWSICLLYGTWGIVRFCRLVFEKGESVLTDGMLNGNVIYLVYSVMLLTMLIVKVISDLVKRAGAEE